MFCTLLIIKKPTIINAGSVANVGTAANKGVNNTESKNKAATTIEVKPVRPPDDEQLGIKKSQQQGNIQQAMLQLIQINAQIRTLDTQIKAESTVIERSVSAATADLERNQREYQQRTSTTNNELLADQADLQKANLDLQKAKADLEFAVVDRDRYEDLSRNGAIGKRQFEQKKLIVVQTKSILEAEKKIY